MGAPEPVLSLSKDLDSETWDSTNPNAQAGDRFTLQIIPHSRRTIRNQEAREPMPNITVSVSQSAYRCARVWAAKNDKSVSAIVQYCIQRLPHLPVAQDAVDARNLARTKTPSSGCETVKQDQPIPLEPLTDEAIHSLTETVNP
jgi:hypothetical protein